MKITTQFTGVISTGEFENERPLFALEEEFDGADDKVKARQEVLYQICRQLFDKVQKESIVRKLEKIRKDLRFYPRNGEQYPSVTSIIGWDDDFFITEEELLQYAAQGEINHLKLSYFIKDKKWYEAKEIPEAHYFMVILKGGSLKLPFDSGNLPAFLEKYPIDFIDSETIVYNDEHKYAGRRDAYGTPVKSDAWDKLKVKYVPTLFDLKRTAHEKKNFKQLSGYAEASPEKIEQLVVIPISDGPESKPIKQGFSQPLITQNIEAYFKMFLQDREQFYKRFLI